MSLIFFPSLQLCNDNNNKKSKTLIQPRLATTHGVPTAFVSHQFCKTRLDLNNHLSPSVKMWMFLLREHPAISRPGHAYFKRHACLSTGLQCHMKHAGLCHWGSIFLKRRQQWGEIRQKCYQCQRSAADTLPIAN